MKKSRKEILAALRRHKKELKEKYGVMKIGIFGSFSRGEENEQSDIDVLVKFEKVPTYFVLLELEEYLSEILGRKVDLVTPEGLSPYIRPYIEKEIEYA